MSQPEPKPMVGAFRSLAHVDRHRHLDCPTYEACLDTACSRGWVNFSCRQCPMWAEPAHPGGDGGLGEDIPSDLTQLQGAGSRGPASDEHRRRISEAMKAMHAKRRAEREDA